MYWMYGVGGMCGLFVDVVRIEGRKRSLRGLGIEGGLIVVGTWAGTVIRKLGLTTKIVHNLFGREHKERQRTDCCVLAYW